MFGYETLMYDSLEQMSQSLGTQSSALSSVISPILQCWRILIFLEKEFVLIKKTITL